MATFPVPEHVPLPFNVRLSTELLEDINALAERHRTTKSRIVRGLLQQALEQIKSDNDPHVVEPQQRADG
jgi:metal-responsive CopG/Arc/MetJ family transcriptional regulator